MDEFLIAAKEFNEDARRSVNLFDVGVALLLEFFSLPVLRFTKYQPLKDRALIHPVSIALGRLKQAAPDAVAARLDRLDDLGQLQSDLPEFAEALTLIGQGLGQRHRTIRLVNKVALALMLGVIALYAGVVAAIGRAVVTWNVAHLLGTIVIFLLALMFATGVCLTNRHWRAPRGGFRGDSG